MLTVLTVFSGGLWGQLGLAIIALTIIVRLIILPLTLRQLRSTKRMQALQPQLQELQKKYGKNKEKLSKETMKLYKEAKISPLGCIFPMLIQMPVWIALYQAIIRMLNQPPAGVNLNFLWMNLAGGGDTLFRGDIFLAILVFASMFVLQKMSTMPSPDPKQQQMTSIMTWMMPGMFGLITMTLPCGLGVYFLTSNIIGIVMQYFITGWGSLRLPSWLKLPAWVKLPNWLRRGAEEDKGLTIGSTDPAKEPTTTNITPAKGKGAKHGKRRDKRKNRR